MLVATLVGCAGAPQQAGGEAATRADPLQGWREFAFPGKRSTRYTGATEDGRRIVRAEADSAASMLRRRVHIEPRDLGQVHFSWQVVTPIPGADLGDANAADSPVRLVLAFDGDHARLSPRNRMVFDLANVLTGESPPYATLMYVWDNKAPVGSVLFSHRTDRVRKIVLESGAEQRGRWLHYKRDVAADFRKAFGEDAGALIGVGIMTDSDNTRSHAAGNYGEVRFLTQDGRAVFGE
jgi:hypothetical protein